MVGRGKGNWAPPFPKSKGLHCSGTLGCITGAFLYLCINARRFLPRFAPGCFQDFVAGPRPPLESIGVLGKLQGIFVCSEVYERKAHARKSNEVGMHMNKVVLVGVTQTLQ